MEGRRLLGRIRTDLADAKGKRWKDDYLYDLITDFLADVSVKQPQFFSKPRVVKVGPGTPVDFAGCCLAVSEVDGVVDDSGVVIKPLRAVASKAKDMYSRKACTRPEADARLAGAPDTYSTDPKAPTTVYFDPPVPPGKKFKMQIRCVPKVPPVKANSKVNFPSHLFPDLFRYVRAEALGINQDSASSQAVSAREGNTVNRNLQQKGSALNSFLKDAP